MKPRRMLSAEFLVNLAFLLSCTLLALVIYETSQRASGIVEAKRWLYTHMRALTSYGAIRTTVLDAELELYRWAYTGEHSHIKRAGSLLSSLSDGFSLLEVAAQDDHRLAVVLGEMKSHIRSDLENIYQRASREAESLAAGGQSTDAGRRLVLSELADYRDDLAPLLARAISIELEIIRDKVRFFLDELGKADGALGLVGILAILSIALHRFSRYLIQKRENAVALSISENRIRTLLDNTVDSLLLIDSTGYIQLANPSTESMFEFDKRELPGRHLADLLAETSEADIRNFAEQMHSGSPTTTREYIGRKKSGTGFPIDLTVIEVETLEGRQLLATIRDITIRQQTERWRRDFIGLISDDLREPLTAIRGSLGLLGCERISRLPEKAADLVEVAERNTLRLISMINDLLELETLETGTLPMEIKECDLADIIKRSFESVEAFAALKEITLTSKAEVCMLDADPDRLVQVLVNLLSNAVKFSPQGGIVTVQAVMDDSAVTVSVVDNGRGIPAQHRDSIFERFKQVDASDAREKGGTGLGLAICKTIIEQHGGTIGVTSEEGRGATFFFRLPLKRKHLPHERTLSAADTLMQVRADLPIPP